MFLKREIRKKKKKQMDIFAKQVCFPAIMFYKYVTHCIPSAAWLQHLVL